MKLIDSPLCSFGTLQSPGTFLHMMWDCLPVAQFWCDVASILSDLVGESVPATVPVLILNVFSELNTSRTTTRIILASLTAAKKMVM